MSLNEIETQLKALQQSATDAIASVESLDNLEPLRVKYLGKKGELSQILRGMGKLSPEDRPPIGALANEVKEDLQNRLEMAKNHLETAAIAAQIEAETLDVTMPGSYRALGRQHPLNSTRDRMIDIFVGLGYTVAEGLEMETDYYNFEALNTPAEHPARDMQDT
ncbi:MAG: phenylalanine--tRNA ligase subunit alpha, partial [Spirulinaceae cyanobacterium]